MDHDAATAIGKIEAQIWHLEGEIKKIRDSQKILIRFCAYATALLIGKWLGLPI